MEKKQLSLSRQLIEWAAIFLVGSILGGRLEDGIGMKPVPRERIKPIWGLGFCVMMAPLPFERTQSALIKSALISTSEIIGGSVCIPHTHWAYQGPGFGYATVSSFMFYALCAWCVEGLPRSFVIIFGTLVAIILEITNRVNYGSCSVPRHERVLLHASVETHRSDTSEALAEIGARQKEEGC